MVGARWFGAKGRIAEAAEVVDVPLEDDAVALAIVEVRFAAGTHEHYLVALGEGDEPEELLAPEAARVTHRRSPRAAGTRRSRAARR